MKIKGLLLAAFSVMGMGGVFAQGIEYDDMYFNAEDRAKLKEQRATELAYKTPAKSKKFDVQEEEERLNPTDSYSARNVNPEYTSRAHTKIAQSDDEDYFVHNYQYNRNQYNNWNNDFNNWYSSPWYRNNYYGPAINSWHSPYYGYNSWNSPWYDPFWSYNGWSSSFSFHYGNTWNYGWGGYYNYWNRPYWGWDPYFGGIGYYGGSYWNNYMYPGTVVVVNQVERGNVVYGKRPTRSTTIIADRNYARSRTNVTSSTRDGNTSGRMVPQTTRQEQYYNRTQRSSSSSYGDRSNTQYNRSRSWDSWNNNNSSYTPSRSSDYSSSPSYSPSRSSSSDAGTRTNTGSGSSGGRRGRD